MNLENINLVVTVFLTVIFIFALIYVRRSTVRKFTGSSSLKHLPTESFKSYVKKYSFTNGLEAYQEELNVKQTSELKKITEVLKDKDALSKFLCIVLHLDAGDETVMSKVKSIKIQEVGAVMKDFFSFNQRCYQFFYCIMNAKD